MLRCPLPKPAQNRLSLGGTHAERRSIFDQLVILLRNDVPVNRVFGEHGFQARVALQIAGKRAIELLAGDGFEPWQQLEAQEMAESKRDDTLTVTIDVLAINLHLGTVAQHPFDHR